MLAAWVTGVSHGQVWLLAGCVCMGIVASVAAFPPGSLSLPTRLSSIFALGYACLGLCAALLVIAHQLSARNYLFSLIAVALALAAVAWRRGSVQRHPLAIWTELKGEPVALVSGLVVVTALALTRPPPLLGYGSSSAWRYWADAAQIADAGHVPTQSPQWGTTFPFTVSKALMNAFDAASTYLVGSDLSNGVWALTWFPVVGWALALWAVGYELGLRRTAPLLAVAGTLAVSLPAGVVANGEIARDLQQFKAENVGRMVAFAALALGIRQLRSNGELAGSLVAGLLFACAATTHLVPTLVALCILAGVAGVTAVEQRGSPTDFKPAALGVATMLIVAVSLPALSGGDIGFQGASGVYQPFHLSGEPQPLDPTAAFIHHMVPFPAAGVRWEDQPKAIIADAAKQATGLAHPSRVWLLAIAAALIAASLLLPGRRPAAVAAAITLAAALLAGAFLFSYRYHTVVPGGFGEKRLFDYIALPWILIGCCLLEAIVQLAGRIGKRGTDALGGITVLAAAFFLLSSQPSVARPSSAAAAAYRSALTTIRANTPCGAHILFTFRTTGSVQLLAHRVGVLEGMAPYLRPNLLNPTLTTLYGAHEFFVSPISHPSFLTAHDIDYVAVVSGQLIYQAIHESGVRANLRRLQRSPQLKQVVDRPGLLLFRVEKPRPVRWPPPPGYGC